MNFWERTNGGDGYGKSNDSAVSGQANWQDKIDEYASKSQDELMRELLSSGARMKADGTLTAQDLDNFYSRVEAFLNDEQRQRMRALIEMLKR